MTSIYDQARAVDVQTEPWLAEPVEDWRPRQRHRHYRDRSRHPLARGVAIGLVAALVLVGIVYAVRPQHPAVVKLHTVSTTPSTLAPGRAVTPVPSPTTDTPVYDKQGQRVPAGTPGAVPAGSGPPATIVGMDGKPLANPIMQPAPGVAYAGPNYYGAPQVGVGPPMASVPGYGLPGCALYVGRQQIGWQFPAAGQPCTANVFGR